MAGLKGKSGPPGNMNAFKHGLAAIQKRREEGVNTEHEESVRPPLELAEQIATYELLPGWAAPTRCTAS